MNLVVCVLIGGTDAGVDEGARLVGQPKVYEMDVLIIKYVRNIDMLFYVHPKLTLSVTDR